MTVVDRMELGTPDANGIVQVEHGMDGSPYSVMLAVADKSLKAVLVAIDATRFLVKFWQGPTGKCGECGAAKGQPSVTQEPVRFRWRAEL